MNQAKFTTKGFSGTVSDWIDAHSAEYAAVEDRLAALRNVLLNGRIEMAARLLKRSYVFATLSIQTSKERHERAFTAHYAGDTSLKEAYAMTVYGNQKYGWAESTPEDTDFRILAEAVRAHVSNDRYDTLLEVVDDTMTGVSYRKGSFMLAMCGLWEYMCVDSNVARYADWNGRTEFNSADAYMTACREIYNQVNASALPFIVQWAIYDFERGEHARHMAYFREVVGPSED